MQKRCWPFEQAAGVSRRMGILWVLCYAACEGWDTWSVMTAHLDEAATQALPWRHVLFLSQQSPAQARQSCKTGGSMQDVGGCSLLACLLGPSLVVL